ncbi:MAG: hypothetical protein BMS9Abin17_0801 [Acidimicrobiia bacterium]|nr:MAG: hypothetical protein BMS9Abin17_0801 [Acidimicrobiia bacterium]
MWCWFTKMVQAFASRLEGTVSAVWSEDAVAHRRSDRPNEVTEHNTSLPAGGPTDLELVVRSYPPDGDQLSHRVALDALESDRPMWPRSEFDPGHFTASGFVASPDGTAMLLILHGKLGRWLQPGGHVESGDDTVEDVVRREVSEETGVRDIERLGRSLLRIDAHTIPQHAAEPEHTHIDLGMGFHALDEKIGPLDEVIDARWVRFDELHRYAVDNAVLKGASMLRKMVEGG